MAQGSRLRLQFGLAAPISDLKSGPRLDMHIYVYVFTYYTHMYIYIYIHIYLYMYTYILHLFGG